MYDDEKDILGTMKMTPTKIFSIHVSAAVLGFCLFIGSGMAVAESSKSAGKVPGLQPQPETAIKNKANLNAVDKANGFMDQAQLEATIKDLAQASKGGEGVVEFTYSNVNMFLISDPSYDRMRIVAPITEYKKLTPEQIDAVMEANFHQALDARYAVSEGVLYAAFIHPLGPLNISQIESAVYQVANLALSFGTVYTSGAITYGGNK